MSNLFPALWFKSEAEEALRYTSRSSRIRALRMCIMSATSDRLQKER